MDLHRKEQIKLHEENIMAYHNASFLSSNMIRLDWRSVISHAIILRVGSDIQ